VKTGKEDIGEGAWSTILWQELWTLEIPRGLGVTKKRHSSNVGCKIGHFDKGPWRESFEEKKSILKGA